jgi:hypothetical protein
LERPDDSRKMAIGEEKLPLLQIQCQAYNKLTKDRLTRVVDTFIVHGETKMSNSWGGQN